MIDYAEQDYEEPLGGDKNSSLQERFRRFRQASFVGMTSSSDDDDSSSESQMQSFAEPNASGPITSSGHMEHQNNREAIPDNTAVIRASKKARMLRILVVIVFTAFTICLPLTIYTITQRNAEESFKEVLSTLTAKLISSVQRKLAEKLSAMDAFGRAFTSYELSSDQSWPMVTLPNFELRGRHVNELGGFLSVGLLPLVDSSIRDSWQNATQTNLQWLTDANHICGTFTVSSDILQLDSSEGLTRDDSSGPFLPTWQQTPAEASLINVNYLSHPRFAVAANVAISTSSITLSRLEDLESLGEAQTVFKEYYNCLLSKSLDAVIVDGSEYQNQPLSTIFFPVFGSFSKESRQIVGLLSAIVNFETLFVEALAEDTGGLVAVLENTCGDVFSFEIEGQLANYLGPYDLHNPKYDNLVKRFDLSSTEFQSASEVQLNDTYCPYTTRIYPQDALFDKYNTNKADVYAIIAACIALFVVFIGLLYDYYLHERMKNVEQAAEASRAIVSSLFPENVRDRILGTQDADSRRGSNDSKRGNLVIGDATTPRRTSNENGSIVEDIIKPIATPITSMMAGVASLAPAKMRLRFFLHEEDLQNASNHGDHKDYDHSEHAMNPHIAPIADLFPHCTVLFADIEGFTAWSSERQPEQVFVLLQTIFQAFDRIAKKKEVFKVETFGDCYIAVAGLPDPQPDHALRMTKFARSCLNKVNEITKKLEVSLGPGTGDLRMRFGLDSGPVTAGVLRGEKSRFQLFGATVNAASRMESTGKANRIQISPSTAQLLIEAGKENWIVPRSDGNTSVHGHSSRQTYWVLTRRQEPSDGESSRPKFIPVTTMQNDEEEEKSVSSNGSVWGDEDEWKDGSDEMENSRQTDRQVEWLVDLLQRLISQIVAGRGRKSREEFEPSEVIIRDGTVLEEITESIELPKFDPRAAKAIAARSSAIRVPKELSSELREFVKCISKNYRKNPFHNFSHAIHVTMSANKLLDRIVKPEFVNYHRESVFQIASDMHDYTYGITSDPLTHFAIMFATLIHDVDHTGVSNHRRNQEQPHLAEKYKARSVAEQNSVDMAWDLLMEDRFQRLRRCLFATKAELKRFRQLVVNLVMATDIFEKEMKSIREARWARVFRSDISDSVSSAEFRNLKAAIVIEHIIQAADVAHTMQHWKVYTKWNECLFREMYEAFQAGRSEKDPSEGWYKGELWFFDNYVIPLARKLEECRVFGVASDECLNYALENRKEWAVKGEAMLEQMTRKIKQETTPKPKLVTMGRRESVFLPPHKLQMNKPALSSEDEILKMEVIKPSFEKKMNGNNILLDQKMSDSVSSVSPTDDEEEDIFSA
eukprot:CAMPEP_0113621262 /NCGR_PEP_ID=MMETSP0017_2-20120614/10860_1 /TAXON_ID=2856 /ORGANISM="Cylindrotheca closterium" /LENGTH=1329 /DNA_ID=CAMNT_0000530993 /DNA_START=95 /DNA_END=4084 /DNA_ORIENTATION=- /assembly_acc=CAM_ASM_000147